MSFFDTMFRYADPKDEIAVRQLMTEKELMDQNGRAGTVWTKAFGYVQQRFEGQPAPLNCDTCRLVTMHYFSHTELTPGPGSHLRSYYECGKCQNSRIWG